MVEATKVTGVRKFVFSGVIHPSISKMANHAAKLPSRRRCTSRDWISLFYSPPCSCRLSTIAGAACLSADKALPYAKLASGGSGVDRRKAGIWHVRVVCPGMVNRVELAAMMSETLGRNIEAGEPSFDEWARMANIPDGPLREVWHTCTRTTTCMASPVATLSCCGRFSAASPARYNSIFVSLPTDSFTAF